MNCEYTINNDKFNSIKLCSLENKEEDYLFVEDILTDDELMMTSTIFNRKSAKNKDDIVNVFKSFIDNTSHHLGMFKICCEHNIVGVAGFVDILKNTPDIVEYGILIKKKFQSFHIGGDVSKFLLKTQQKNDNIKNIIITCFANNVKSEKIFKNFNMIQLSSFKKDESDNSLIHIYSLNDYKMDLIKNNLLTNKIKNETLS